MSERLGVHEKTDAYEFTYQYPARVAASPGLVAWLDEDRAALQAEFLPEETKARLIGENQESCPFGPLEVSSEWEIAADLKGWLSLKQSVYTFTGGAHGQHSTSSILWDQKAQRARRPISLFLSEAALDQAAQPALCNALDRERSRRRNEGPIVRDPSDPATACVAASSATVLLGSSGPDAFDRVGFLFVPYVAGPYSEGTYEVTLPVTPAVIAAVRPEFRSAFALGR